MTSSIRQDLSFAARALRKRPAFTLLAVLTVALGISLNTTIYAVVHDVLWKPLPYAASERLVLFNEATKSGSLNCSYPNALDWKQRAGSFDDIALFRGFPAVTLRQPGGVEVMTTGFTDPNLFSLFQVQSAMGRIFSESDNAAGAGEPVAVISDRAWERYFGRDPAIIGRHARISVSFAGKSASSMVIGGVLPPGFRFSNIDLWLPLKRFRGPIDADRGNHWFLGLGRLKQGASIEQARAELSAVSRGLEQQYPASNTGVRGTITPLIDVFTGTVKTPLLLLMGAVTFVWLIACGNVVHLVLTRTVGRGREIAVRTALGASRRRLAQLLLAESFWIALIGGSLGALFAWWGVAWAIAYQPGVLPRAQGIHLNQPAMLYAATITALTFFTLGLVPLWRSVRANLAGGLQSAGRAGAERGRQRFGWLMIAGELAMAGLLLAGAGLMIQTLRNLGQVDLGYRPEGVMAVNLRIPAFKFTENGNVSEERLASFTERIRQEARALPGFVSASMAMSFQVGGNGMVPPVTIPGGTNSATPPNVPTTAVTPEFFSTLRIPLRSGRLFTQDGPEVVVNEDFVRRFFPNENPLGRKVAQGDERQIVGVVGNTKLQGTLAVTQPEIYWAGSGAWDTPVLLVRVAGRPASVASGLRDLLRKMEPDMRVGTVEILSETEAARTSVQRFTRALLSIFAALALLLASLGVYGVASYGVAQRAHEIGVRMALGASRGNIARLVLGQTLAASIVGAVAGATGGVALARFLGTQLYAVRPNEPWIYALVMAILAVVTLLAATVPVVRASRIDPALSLRQE